MLIQILLLPFRHRLKERKKNEFFGAAKNKKQKEMIFKHLVLYIILKYNFVYLHIILICHVTCVIMNRE